MPITECPTHGESGCLEMCEHLAADLQRGVFSPFTTLPVYPMRLCDACVQAHDVQTILQAVLPDPASIAALRAQATGVRSIGPDHLFETALLERDHPAVLAKIVHVYEVVNRTSRLRCAGCIDQVQVDHARRAGLTLDVEPFDHTIQNSEDAQIVQLRTLLLDRMSPRGNHGDAFYGCQIFAGTACRPLRIRLFGVTDPSEQAETLAVLDGYFANLALYQRHVAFYDPIRWTTVEHADGVQRTRLPDVLLHEVVVR